MTLTNASIEILCNELRIKLREQARYHSLIENHHLLLESYKKSAHTLIQQISQIKCDIPGDDFERVVEEFRRLR